MFISCLTRANSSTRKGLASLQVNGGGDGRFGVFRAQPSCTARARPPGGQHASAVEQKQCNRWVGAGRSAHQPSKPFCTHRSRVSCKQRRADRTSEQMCSCPGVHRPCKLLMISRTFRPRHAHFSGSAAQAQAMLPCLKCVCCDGNDAGLVALPGAADVSHGLHSALRCDQESS